MEESNCRLKHSLTYINSPRPAVSTGEDAAQAGVEATHMHNPLCVRGGGGLRPLKGPCAPVGP